MLPWPDRRLLVLSIGYQRRSRMTRESENALDDLRRGIKTRQVLYEQTVQLIKLFLRLFPFPPFYGRLRRSLALLPHKQIPPDVVP
jgi:hypothetical protein